jgi:hypothetical protein
MSNTLIPPEIEDTITARLIRLIQLCERYGLDLDRLMNEARHRHSGGPDVEESG